MLKKNLILAVTIFFFAKSSFAQTDPIYTALNNIDFDNYVNKPIDSILAVIPTFTTAQAKIYGQSTTYNARVLAIEYPNQVTLLLYPKRFQYMNPYDPSQIWDFSLFRKERAWHISLSYQGKNMKDVVIDY